jgi:type II restriction enzyme
MSKIAEAQIILESLGMPPPQCNEMAALTLLALCGMKPDDLWPAATRQSLTIAKGIMAFMRTHYGKHYAENTRESIRRQVLHQFIQGNIAVRNPDAPLLSTNSSRNHYALSEDALRVIRLFGSKNWAETVQIFRDSHGSLRAIYEASRASVGIPLVLPDGTEVSLSPGDHNQLQAAVINRFAPQFAPGAQLLYLGDTADKDLFVAKETLQMLGILVTEHDKLPDIVLYVPDRNWLYLIEVVTSHGPMSPKRIIELKALLTHCSAGAVFVTAFATFADFRKYMRSIAWETEVWIAEVPDHLIHFNGDRFLGPRD